MVSRLVHFPPKKPNELNVASDNSSSTVTANATWYYQPTAAVAGEGFCPFSFLFPSFFNLTSFLPSFLQVPVYTIFQSGSVGNRSPAAQFTVTHAGGTSVGECRLSLFSKKKLEPFPDCLPSDHQPAGSEVDMGLSRKILLQFHMHHLRRDLDKPGELALLPFFLPFLLPFFL